MGVSVDFIVDSVERLVLPVDAKAAFQLLVALFEADGVAMENCREHDWFQRAVRVTGVHLIVHSACNCQPGTGELEA
jgi:hypothetical protein